MAAYDAHRVYFAQEEIPDVCPLHGRKIEEFEPIGIKNVTEPLYACVKCVDIFFETEAEQRIWWKSFVEDWDEIFYNLRGER